MQTTDCYSWNSGQLYVNLLISISFNSDSNTKRTREVLQTLNQDINGTISNRTE